LRGFIRSRIACGNQLRLPLRNLPMPYPTAARTTAWLLATIGVLVGCSSQPFVKGGDAKSVEIGYSGNLDAATPLARRHCAQYERDARFVDRTIDSASFECVRR